MGSMSTPKEKSPTSKSSQSTGLVTVGRPAIAESRIIGYDGSDGTIKYVPQGERKEVQESMTADEFIQRLIIHIPETHFKMMRNYGIYSRNNSRGKRIERRLVSREKYKRLKKLKTWQFRLMQEYDRNPLKCECGALIKKGWYRCTWRTRNH